jgi:CubicO group peptidase (beta-lactamase class C family)
VLRPSLEALDAAADYSAEMKGEALLVMQGDIALFERYENGFTADTPHLLASGTKSFWGVAAMAAVEDGILSLDEYAADTLTEWQTHPLKSRITVRQLLNLTSGLDPAEDLMRIQGIGDRYAYVLLLAMQFEPGTRFEYGPSHYFAFGELLKRKLDGESPLAYLKRRILNPIGLDVAQWRHDRVGNPMMPFGAAVTAREWAKFGQLVCQRGQWNGRQVINANLLEKCFQPTKVDPRYGLTWWLGGNQTEEPPSLFFAAGKGKQRLYVIRELDLVIVRFGHPARFDDHTFLSLLLNDLMDIPDIGRSET